MHRWTIGECRVLSRGQAAVTAANQSVVLLRGTVVGGTATRPVASRSVPRGRSGYWHEGACRGSPGGGRNRCVFRSCSSAWRESACADAVLARAPSRIQAFTQVNSRNFGISGDAARPYFCHWVLVMVLL